MPAQYECRCRPKFTGNGHTCLPLYGTLTHHQMEREFFVEYFSDLNVTKIKQAKHMHFFQVSQFFALLRAPTAKG